MRPRRRVSQTTSSSQRRHRPDYWLVMIATVLMAIGLVVVYSISPWLSVKSQVSESYFVKKQLIVILLGIVAFLVTSNVSFRNWRKLTVPLAVISVLASAALMVVGVKDKGAFRWIKVGGISFQPAELIKFSVLIWLAGFLADKFQSKQLDDYRSTLKPILIMLTAVAIVVGKLQSDLGSTMVIVAVVGAMIYVVGLPLRRITMIAGVIAVAVVLLISGSSYRRARLATYLNPGKDCLTTGYQTCQALITVGSGGMFGLGLGRSVQAFGYLPEAANDSIFAIMAEKFGFVGTTFIIGLFAVLFTRIKWIVERAPDAFSQLIATGVLAWMTTQTIINIGAMIGLLPLKGITLPFISYGGTSILFVCAAIGVVFHISRYTSYGLTAAENTRRVVDDHRSDRRRLRGAYHPNPGSR